MTLFSRLFESRATTFQQVWGSDSDNPAMDFSGKRVTRDQALGLSAVMACVRFITDAVSTLPIHAHSADRALLDPQPDWLVQPVPRDPSTTMVVHLQQVTTSLLLDGNSYTYAAPSIFDPQELRVLDPRRVEPQRRPDGSVRYNVRDDRNGIVAELDWTQLIHIPLIRLAGELKGVSPLEAERLTFSSAIAAEELAARFMRAGTWLSAIVEAPQGVQFTEEQANDLLAKIERRYSGSKNAAKVGLLTGGATLKPLTITPEQAQFLETRQYDDERIFRLFRVFPALAGMIREGATSNASAVQQALAFEKHTIRPLVTLIETGYRSLVGHGAYLKVNTKGLLRGDPKTQAEIYHYALSDQWAKKGEVRDWEDMQRFPDEADNGFLETPNNNEPRPSVEDPAA